MFYEHERFGAPVMRPMLSEFPLDKKTFKLDDQYMLSDRLLVRPIMERGQTEVLVYFPSTSLDGKEGVRWYKTWDHEEVKDFLGRNPIGIQRFEMDFWNIPVFQRGGTIIPKKENAQKASVYMQDDPITLIIALDESMKAKGTLYIDDEKSYGYKQGEYLYLEFEYDNDKLTCKFIDKNATFATKSNLHKVIVSGLNFVPNKANLEGSSSPFEIIVDSRFNHFVIQNIDVSVFEEWTLIISAAHAKHLAYTALIAMLTVHVSRFLL